MLEGLHAGETTINTPSSPSHMKAADVNMNVLCVETGSFLLLQMDADE